MSDLEHLVPSSPWPSRRSTFRALRGVAFVLAGIVALNLLVRAVPREAVERALLRRPRLVPASGTWPQAPYDVQTLRMRTLPLDAPGFARIAGALGYAPADVRASAGRYEVADATGRLTATRTGDVWRVVLSRARSGPARPASEQAARRVIAGVGLDPAQWDLLPVPAEAGRFAVRPVPKAEVPVEAVRGPLLTRLELSGDRVERLALPLVRFEPGEVLDIDVPQDVAPRLRWWLRTGGNVRRLPVEARLVLQAPNGSAARDGVQLVPTWAFDTGRSDYGTLYGDAVS